ncbi:MAG: MotA/TolQ/ExbB proton channel family protein [Leptonema sp. (in: bacteria)]
METLIELFYKGGWVMWPILIQGIVSLSVFLEKEIFLWITKIPKKTLKSILEKINSNKESIYTIQEKYHNNENIQLIIAFLETNYLDPEKQEKLLKKKGEELIKNLNKRTFLLSLNAQIAPLFGLLGTVLGMIEAFKNIADLQIQPAPSIVASGIWVAMLTTAFGLMVSIPSYFFYIIIEKKIEERVDLLNLTLETLEEANIPKNEVFVSSKELFES